MHMMPIKLYWQHTHTHTLVEYPSYSMDERGQYEEFSGTLELIATF